MANLSTTKGMILDIAKDMTKGTKMDILTAMLRDIQMEENLFRGQSIILLQLTVLVPVPTVQNLNLTQFT